MSVVPHHNNELRTMHYEDVAVEALTIAEAFYIKVSKKEMVRAALIHDGFRYD